MKSFKECVPCILRQVDEIGNRLFKNDEKTKNLIHEEASKILEKTNISSMTPPEATTLTHQAISKLTGIKDFYKHIKKENNEFALSLYPKLKEIMQNSEDKLLAAIRLSIAGNIIDYGAHSSFDVNSSIKETMAEKFTVDDYLKFKKDLANSHQVLYIGDNAGEIVFDKLLVSETSKLDKKVVFAVKSKPILNDVMMEDAEFVSMTKLAKVVESGSDLAGTMLNKVTKEFLDIYDASDLIIAKGQGNIETLEDENKSIYYLLKCKCIHLSRRLKCKKNAIILVSNSSAYYKAFLRADIC